MSLLKEKRVLIVEDTTIAATYLARELANMGANVIGLARSEQQALQLVEKNLPELILMDIHLAEGGSGIAAAREIVAKYNIPLVYTTSYSDDNTISQALETSPYGYIVKPFDAKTIKTTAETALKRFELEQKVAVSEKRFRVAAEASQFGIMQLDENGASFTFDGAHSLKRRFGAGTQISRDEFLALFDDEDKDDVLETLEKRKSLRKTINIAENADEEVWLDVVFSEVDMAEDKVVIGAVIDITDKQRQIKKLQLSNVILDQLAEGVAVLNKEFQIRDANQALSTLMGVEHRQLLEITLFDLGLDEDAFVSVSEKQSVVRHKGMLLKSDGTEFPAFITLSRLKESFGDASYVATISDITDLSRAEKKLETLAFTDQLTGAGNRNYLKLILNEHAYAGSIQALIFIDLDGFKLINDTYGHDIGDELLASCAGMIKTVIREDDTFIRHGGDEFVILVQDNTDLETLGTRLLNVFDEPILAGDRKLKISASIGIAETKLGTSASDLLKHADIAMYEAKHRGKNQVVLYSSQQNEAVEHRLYLEQGLYKAIIEKELYASFQPIVDQDGNIVALEALCRWSSQDIGDIHPEAFIPIAEEIGLINALGMKMLKEVCIANVLLKESGLSHIKLHINVSILQLNSHALVEQFIAYLKDFSVLPQDIVLEVTESAMHDIGTKRILRELYSEGFVIAIDDFGAGYASVSELTEPYAEIVKLDKSLAPSDDKVHSKSIIADNIVQLCQKLGKQVLMEGIEGEIQADFARSVGCNMMQGYHYGKPMSLNHVMHKIQERNSATVA